MSRILFIQFIRRCGAGDTGPVFDQSLGQLSAALRRDGHQTHLIRIDGFDPKRVRSTVDSVQPDFAYCDIRGSSIDAATRTLREIRERYRMHVLVGGSLATTMPDMALSLPGVCAVVLGDGDRSLPGYVAQGNNGSPRTGCEGIWTIEGGTLHKRGAAALMPDLDELPFADRELFGARPDERVFDITVGRGCPARCAYCINERLREAIGGGAEFIRRRSPDHVCDELDLLCERYPETEFIRFTDHAFIHDVQWLEDFSQVYAERCGMPFKCHVRANALDARRADLLLEAGCATAEIEIISGSDFVRNEILEMDTSDRQVADAFALLRERGIESHAVNFIGAPDSTSMAEAETVEMNRRVRPEYVEARVYYPFVGTAARDLCKEMGWLSNRSEESYSKQLSVLDMPGLSANQIRQISRSTPDEMGGSGTTGLPRKVERGLGLFYDMCIGVGSAVRRAIGLITSPKRR
jgi:radical SAM superfamily enzyme YgiQ (UPF0313 family)